MQKRLLWALALSFIVLFAWQNLITKPQLQPSAPVTEKRFAQTPAETKNKEQISLIPPAQPRVLSEYLFDTNLLRVVFIDQNAKIERVIFKNFKNFSWSLNNGFFVGNGGDYKRQVIGDKEVRYIYQDGQKRITKAFIFSNDSYEIKFLVTVENISQQPLQFSFPLFLGTLDLQNPGVFQGISVALEDRTVYPNINKEANFQGVNFLSLRDSHFCVIAEPVSKKYAASLQKSAAKETMAGLQSPGFDILPNQKIIQEFKVYIGPQDLNLIKQANPDWQAVVYFGKLDVIAHILLKSLVFLHSIVKNWGISIILLSLIVYLILFPLTLQQLRSMREMQRVQPKVEELRCKYRDDPAKLQKATMELYKEHKINPLGGCLPMLLQIPVFISFYLVLARSIELKGASFLWIKDLSEPDKLITLQQALPFLGNEINLLPVLMMAASFFQQKFSSAQMSGSSASQQKLMMFLFPLMMVAFFYHMPSGLVLYWLSNTVFTVAQQALIAKSK